jgi:hypothetical protein
MASTPLTEIARGLAVTALASIGGGLLGAAMSGANPLGGLALIPFTLFGSFALLLPVYLWFSTGRRGNRVKGYKAVLLAGFLGGPVFLMAIFGFGGANSSLLSLEAIEFYGMGAAFGTGSAISWIAAHHFTRQRPSAAIPAVTP